MAVSTWKKQAYALALLDEEFLATLLEQNSREIYARIASLDMDELPIEYIEGKVTGGTINIDGSSSVQRTCSLTMVAENVDFHDYYWGVRTKFKLEIGVTNNLEGNYAAELGVYPDIVWFPQGTFIIAAFNTSLSLNSYTISITGKDKMCMLNGELGGQLFASVDFGQEEYKNKIFTKISTLDTASSETLLSKKYYKVAKISEEYGLHIKDSTKLFYRAGTQYTEVGEFDRYNSSVVYYKKVNNAYTAVSQAMARQMFNLFSNDEILETDTNFSFTLIDEGKSYSSLEQCVGKYYKIENKYKPVEANKYYSAIYIPYQLVNTPEDIFEKVFFSANPNINAGEVTWEPGKYYYLKKDTQPYYILDNAKEGPIYNDKQYFKIVDLYEEDYEYSLKKIPLEKIIRESVHSYANEPYSNIIINDLDDFGLEQLTYKGDTPLIALRNRNTGNIANLMLAEKFTENNCEGFTINVEDNVVVIKDSSNNILLSDSLTSDIIDIAGLAVIYFNSNTKKYTLSPIANTTSYTIAPIYYGQDLGYRVTTLTYTGDLVSSIGETLTSILDKIKQMLGDFEYFYNTDGQFVFQRKKTYVNTSWSQMTSNGDETYVTYANDKKKFSFNFEGNRLISAVQNTPVLTNLKNDFVVWGKRTSISGEKIPIHARYAIDKKPTEYMSLRGIFYYTDEAKNNPSDQYKEIIEHDTNTNIFSYTKQSDLIPKCLIDAEFGSNSGLSDAEKRNNTLWYELKDWANYYYLMTGAYPAQRMMKYQQGSQGFHGTVLFPDNTQHDFANQLIIDFYHGDQIGHITLDPDTFIPYYGSGPFQHTYNGCGHTYTDFLNRYNNYGDMISYIYNPQLPDEATIEADGGHIQPINIKKVDWRELIYQMAIDYFAGQGCKEKKPIYDIDGNLVINNPDHFLAEVAARNIDKYPSGYTGYEQYYTDMQGFWRQLYNPDYVPQIEYEAGYYSTENVKLGNSAFYTKEKVWCDKRVKDVQFQYYILEGSEGAQVYNQLITDKYLVDEEAEKNILSKRQYILSASSDARSNAGWNVDIFERPESLNFWIEFLDDGEELSQFSVKAVGDRQKVVNDDKISAVIFKEVPDIIVYDKTNEDMTLYEELVDSDQTDGEAYSNLRLKLQAITGYTWVYLPSGFSQYLTMSYRNISAKNKIDELIYQYAYCIENISITALPVYHLQPNTRIYVNDKNTGIAGEYIVNRITLPLTYNGTMSISATLAPERLY